MKFYTALMISLFSFHSIGQIHTNPGGGPNQFNVKNFIEECPEIDPLVSILQNSFVTEYNKKHNTLEANFFSLIERMSLEELIKNFPLLSKGIITLSCSADESEDLMQIYNMYKAAAEQDKSCEFYLTVTTNKLKLLEGILKVNGKF